MSYLPKLSKKAINEIAKLALESDISWNRDFSFEYTINFIYNIFDLKQYPVTFEMLVEYCNKSVKNNYMIRSLNLITVENDNKIILKDSMKTSMELQKSIDPKFIISCISRILNVDKIIIIGDIHGWWEQSQTY